MTTANLLHEKTPMRVKKMTSRQKRQQANSAQPQIYIAGSLERKFTLAGLWNSLPTRVELIQLLLEYFVKLLRTLCLIVILINYLPQRMKKYIFFITKIYFVFLCNCILLQGSSTRLAFGIWMIPICSLFCYYTLHSYYYLFCWLCKFSL